MVAIKIPNADPDDTGQCGTVICKSFVSAEYKHSEIQKYIPRSVSYEKTCDYILNALEFYQQYRKAR